MKITMTLAAFAIAFAASAFAAGEDDHKPVHGGIVVEGKAADYELVARPDVLQLYLRDHGKPMDVSKATAKVTLLSGSEKQDVSLAPAGDKLEAKGTFKVQAGTKVVAVVSNAGKILGTARFTVR